MIRLRFTFLLVLLFGFLFSTLFAYASDIADTSSRSNTIATKENSQNLLLRQVDIHQDTLVFTYGQDIWQASLASQKAFRLTSFQDQAQSPKLSPDGKWIAFSAQLNGNFDVYIMPVGGGDIRQLTWHPGDDMVRGWSPDSSRIVFASSRETAPIPLPKFFTIHAYGGTPESLPMPRAQHGSYNPKGNKFVYQKITPWDDGWRKYRGGQNQPLRIVDLDTLEERFLPWAKEKQAQPVWIDNFIYFLADRDGVMNVYRMRSSARDSHQVEQLTFHQDYDVKSFSLWKDTLVWEQHGRLYQNNLLKGQPSPITDRKNNEPQIVTIQLFGDFPWTRQQWVQTNKHIESASVSATGKRALFVARGEVFSVPVDQGEERNLSRTWQREVDAQWSPDGKQIAWFSDKSEEYQLIVTDQFGHNAQHYDLKDEGFYKNLRWSPNGEKLSFTDQRQRIWVLTKDQGTMQRIDQDTQVIPYGMTSPSWSPDSNYLAYSKSGKNFLMDIYIHDFSAKKSYPVTDSMADNRSFSWDRNGKYLFITASVDFASKAPWLDLSTTGKAMENYQVYAITLQKNGQSPLTFKRDQEPIEPESEEGKQSRKNDTDESKTQEGKTAGKTSTDDNKVKIDFAGIQNRQVAIPVGKGHFSELSSAESGLLMVKTLNDEEKTLYLFDFDEQKSKVLLKGIKQYSLAANGEALLAQQGSLWKLADDVESIKDAPGLNLSLDLYLDPKREWQQKFREAWRYQRDYFYVENLHGANWPKIWQDYSPLLTGVNHLEDLNYLLDNLGAETSVGHSFNGGGEFPSLPQSQVGLLGADIAIEDSNFVIKRVFTGEQWNSAINQYAPFSPYANQVVAGDVIVAVNDQRLSVNNNFFQYFNGTLNKQTKVTIKSSKTSTTKDYWVKPIENESSLRQMSWVEDNRRYVAMASDNQLAYVWVPDTGSKGYAFFNRYFFAQADRKGVIIDERYNGGGFIADYMIDVLNRKLSGYFNNVLRPERPLTSPGAIIAGPKVLLINEMAGSGGDMFPYLFRFHKLGSIVGTRTWGGLVGIWGVPSFVDGGFMTTPRSGFYDLQGRWAVENEGVAPDIEVHENLLLSTKGKDAQLQKAVKVALEQLQDYQDQRRQPSPDDPIRAVQLKD
ncbi:protease [Thalassotalea litorea]|uniref:Tricorn protease homolog n=1 Tax=Thalassotalea litorea TaxID=2020715 RepID=A0A5R9II79_9GAMM|nr:S41 family peptidase [Thalassotalea litorea]TLU61868.1 protease [Thalassotalea litorea]